MAGSARAERLRRCGATVSFELAGVRVDGGGVLGCWGRELGRERVDWITGVFLVLLCARGEEPGRCVGQATATARWRPRSSAGAAWRGEEAPARGKDGGVESGRDAWVATASRTWPGPTLSGGRAALTAGGGEAEEQGG
jgi:hypothetical protein